MVSQITENCLFNSISWIETEKTLVFHIANDRPDVGGNVHAMASFYIWLELLVRGKQLRMVNNYAW